MEMESSHRSFDRSREQAPKKPRLADDPNSNNRPFLQRPVSASTQPRFRPPSDRETDSTDSSRGTYQPQPLYGQQFEELVSQYKAALSELTFNSKPIITNLTIIAGENVHAAKAISATVCSNILEVPSEQKLPSLYLLDSIVKNIGRDYIKYFAAKLPEVFCKAYKQVDSSIHSGMRHLFGTWRGVFPSQTLQIIEKELGLPLAVNGSSSGNTASRADSHSQRPPHSIHVNPKYLEARQRLQQPSRVKRTTNDASGTMVNSTGDAERPDRLSSTGRPWTEPPVNMQNIQEPHREAATYGKNKQPPYGDYEYNSKLARNSSLGIGGRLNERIANQREDTPQHGRGSTLTESISSRKNGFDSNHRLANYQASQEANADVHLEHTRGPANISSRRSWKNSEEEEYLWDDMDSRLADQTAVSNSRNDRLILDDPENLEFEARGGKPWSTADAGLRVGIATSDSLLREKKEETAFRSRSSLLRSAQEPLSTDESSPSSISTRAGLWPQSHLGASSLPGRHTHELGHSLTDRNIPQSRSLPRPGHETSMPSGLQNEIKLDHSSVPSQNINLFKFEPRNLPPPLMPYARPFHHVPQARPEKELFDVSSQIQKPSSRISSSATPSATGSTALANLYSPTEVSGQSNTSTLLAAFINSGTFSSELLTGNIPKSSTQDSVMAPSLLGDQPPPTQFTSMIQPLPLVSLSGHAPTDNEPPSSNRSQKKVEKPPPLPPGPPPSSIPGSVSAEAPISMKNVPNPLSNLLSSLVAKGLITASKTQSATTAPSQKSDQLQDQSSEIAATSSMPASIIPTSAIPVSSCNDGVSISEPDFRTSGPSPQLGIKNLLGFEFRPDVIRKFHPSVISELFDDLPHGCSICGLRFKLEEGLTKHSERHSLRKPGTNIPGAASSRGWYADPVDWVSGGPVFRSDPGSAMEKSEMQMVPADENQCVCVLCGELFEDVYCQERDEWMFKGAAYLTVPPNECPAPGLIVHASCISESSLHDLGLPVDIKVEKDA